MGKTLNIVQVHLGTALPDYLYDQLRQTRIFNPALPLYLIHDEGAAVDTTLLAGLDVTPVNAGAIRRCRNHRLFLRRNHLGRRGLGGFWLFASERFFVMESFLEACDLGNVVHMENDVLLYADLKGLLPALETSCAGLGLTLDCERRCIPGFVFIRSREALSKLNDFIVHDSIRRRHNDMEALASFMAQAEGASCSALPVIPTGYRGLFALSNAKGEGTTKPWFDEAFEAFGGIFDAAAIGQFLGGIDTHGEERDTRGFVNETALYDPRNLGLHWKTEEGLKKPFARVGEAEFPVFNLHIHSKNLAAFVSSAPGE